MCGAVRFAFSDASAKFLNQPHGHHQVVGALHVGVRARAVHVHPIKRPHCHAHKQAMAAAWPLDPPAYLDGAQLRRAALSAARSGDRDHLLHAVHRRGARRPDPRRMDPLAALDRDHRRLLRRAAGGAAGRRRHSSGGDPLGDRRVLLCGLLDLDTHPRAHRQQRDDQFLFQSGGRGGGVDRGAVLLDAADRSEGDRADVHHGAVQRHGALSADHRPPPRAGERAGALHLHRDRLDDRARLRRVRRCSEPLDLGGRRGGHRLGALPALPRAYGGTAPQPPIERNALLQTPKANQHPSEVQ